MHVGFTGTQRGLDSLQSTSLQGVLEALFTKWGFTTLHHGDCIGADATVHYFAAALGFRTVIHPPDNPTKRANCKGDECLPEKPYLVRNDDIVIVSNVLVACPGERFEQLRSGTWATVRRARKLCRKIILVYPGGSLQTERP